MFYSNSTLGLLDRPEVLENVGRVADTFKGQLPGLESDHVRNQGRD